MEFPFGHAHHSHHHKRDEDTEDYPPPGSTFSSLDNPPPPPPPSYSRVHQPPPPPIPQPTQVFHTSHVTSPPPPRDFNYPDFSPPPPPHFQTDPFNYNYTSEVPPPPPAYAPQDTAASVHHVSHDVNPYETDRTHRPHLPSFKHHHPHQDISDPSSKPTVRVFTKAAPNFSLTIQHGKIVLAPSDPSNDYQHWYKDEKYSTRVKDQEGFPAFSLVNKVTGDAIKHSIGATHPVRLIRYNPDYLDESVLWTESKVMGDGYRAIRMVNNVHLNVDAFHGDRKSGGVHDGTTIVLWEWNKGDNQLWKIVPW